MDKMKKTIAIIGASGNMGRGLSKALAKAGYPVLMAGPTRSNLEHAWMTIKSQLPQANLEILDCAREAGWEADVIIPAVPYKAQSAVAGRIKDVAIGKVVISVTNPLNDFGGGFAGDVTTSAAEELADQLTHSHIVKAFNTVIVTDFGFPQLDGQTIDGFVAGDDPDAVALTQELVRDAGFHPVFVGTLKASRTLERMTALLTGMASRTGSTRHVGWKVVDAYTSENCSSHYQST